MKEKIKLIVKKTSFYLVIILGCLSSFVVGYYYKTVNTVPSDCSTNVENIKKEEVNLAIDQNSNLIMINLKTGDYTIYEDSIGKTIFSLYAKNVWGQHTNVSK